MTKPRKPANRGRTSSGQPNPVDVHVGARMRLRRTLLGMSQEQLGAALGLTFQQVQKYERGANRVGASRLYDLARALDVPVTFFFDEMPDGVKAQSPSQISRTAGPAPPPEDMGGNAMNRRETVDLIRAYHRIPEPHLRRKIFDLTRALAG